MVLALLTLAYWLWLMWLASAQAAETYERALAIWPTNRPLAEWTSDTNHPIPAFQGWFLPGKHTNASAASEIGYPMPVPVGPRGWHLGLTAYSTNEGSADTNWFTVTLRGCMASNVPPFLVGGLTPKGQVVETTLIFSNVLDDLEQPSVYFADGSNRLWNLPVIYIRCFTNYSRNALLLSNVWVGSWRDR